MLFTGVTFTDTDDYLLILFRQSPFRARSACLRSFVHFSFKLNSAFKFQYRTLLNTRSGLLARE
jgi:hypothetical protein